MDISKAFNGLSTLDSGAYLIPEIVSEGIRDYTAKQPVLANVVNRIPWATNTYFIRKRTAIPTVTWSTDGADLPDAQKSTYAKVSMAVKYVYARGEVSGPEIEAAGSLYDALGLEVEAQARALNMDLSKQIASGYANSNEIEGIYHQVETNTDFNAGTDLDVSGESPKVLSLSLLDRAIDAGLGENNIALTSRGVRRKVNSLLQAQQQFVDRVEVAAGFRVLTYDGVPFVTDLNSEDETTLRISFFDRQQARLLVHKDWTYEPLAKTKDSVDFFIKGYFGFVLEGRPVILRGFTLS